MDVNNFLKQKIELNKLGVKTIPIGNNNIRQNDIGMVLQEIMKNKDIPVDLKFSDDNVIGYSNKKGDEKLYFLVPQAIDNTYLVLLYNAAKDITKAKMECPMQEIKETI